MGDSVAKPANVYDCIVRMGHELMSYSTTMNTVSNTVDDDVVALTMGMLSATMTGLAAEIGIFSIRYEEELKCILIDQ